MSQVKIENALKQIEEIVNIYVGLDEDVKKTKNPMCDIFYQTNLIRCQYEKPRWTLFFEKVKVPLVALIISIFVYLSLGLFTTKETVLFWGLLSNTNKVNIPANVSTQPLAQNNQNYENRIAALETTLQSLKIQSSCGSNVTVVDTTPLPATRQKVVTHQTCKTECK